MACCAFALYLLAQLLGAVDRVRARLPARWQPAFVPYSDPAAAWQPGAVAAPVVRKGWMRRAGPWLAVAAGLELSLMASAAFGIGLVGPDNALPGGLDVVANAALSMCRALGLAQPPV
jgi:hypothetical protein